MSFTPFFILFYSFLCRTLTKSTLFPYTTLFRSGTDVRATLREANDVFDLTDAEVRPDLVCDGPEVFRREKDERELRPVRQLNGDDISGADAEGAPVRRHPIHPGL